MEIFTSTYLYLLNLCILPHYSPISATPAYPSGAIRRESWEYKSCGDEEE
jgi:hypothetical protein